MFRGVFIKSEENPNEGQFVVLLLHEFSGQRGIVSLCNAFSVSVSDTRSGFWVPLKVACVSSSGSLLVSCTWESFFSLSFFLLSALSLGDPAL